MNASSKRIFILSICTLACTQSVGPACSGRITAASTVQIIHKESQEQRLQRLRIADQQKKVDSLQTELDEQRFRLQQMQQDIPGFQDDLANKRQQDHAVITFSMGNVFGGNKGKKAGFHRGDRIIALRDTPQGILMTAIGFVYEVGETDFIADGDSQGMRSEDEVYIFSRDNSKYSLTNLWSIHRK